MNKDLEPMRFGTEIGQWQSTPSGLVRITPENQHEFVVEEAAQPTVAGRTLNEWREFARRDDCLDRMTPSDLRELLRQIPRFHKS